MLGDYLSDEGDFQKEVCHLYIDQIPFKGVPFVEALKKLLEKFRLPGEGQKVDRLMEKFGEKYQRDNPDKFSTAECAFVLAFATIMC